MFSLIKLIEGDKSLFFLQRRSQNPPLPPRDIHLWPTENVFLFKLLIFLSILSLSIIVSIFWGLLLCCYLFPSVLLCYFQVSPKGDQ